LPIANCQLPMAMALAQWHCHARCTLCAVRWENNSWWRAPRASPSASALPSALSAALARLARLALALAPPAQHTLHTCHMANDQRPSLAQCLQSACTGSACKWQMQLAAEIAIIASTLVQVALVARGTPQSPAHSRQLGSAV
jgi:hypothetical protein